MDKISLGIIGCGKHALDNLVPALSRVDRCDLRSFTTKSKIRANAVHKLFPNAVVAENVSSVLSDPALEAIIIASPNNTHAELAQAAIAAGKHVLCEKPAFLTILEAKETLTLAKQKNRVFREAFMYRFHPQHQQARQLIEQHCRELRHVEIKFTYPLPEESNIRLSAAARGGALNDVGCYALDAVQFYLRGSPNYLAANSVDWDCFAKQIEVGRCFSSTQGVDLRTWMSGELAPGISFFALAAMDLPRQNRITFLGAAGAVHLLSAFRSPTSQAPIIIVEDSQGKQRTTRAESADQTQVMLAAFVEEIINFQNSRPVTTDQRWPDPLRNAQLLEAVRIKNQPIPGSVEME